MFAMFGFIIVFYLREPSRSTGALLVRVVRPARRRAGPPQGTVARLCATASRRLSLASTIMTLLAPETSSSTRAFHGLGCLDSCCQAVGMCEEADIRTHANTSSDHDSINMENQGGKCTAPPPPALDASSCRRRLAACAVIRACRASFSERRASCFERAASSSARAASSCSSISRDEAAPIEAAHTDTQAPRSWTPGELGAEKNCRKVCFRHSFTVKKDLPL